MPNWVLFLLGLLTGVAVMCLVMCIFINLEEDKRSRKENEERKQGNNSKTN